MGERETASPLPDGKEMYDGCRQTILKGLSVPTTLFFGNAGGRYFLEVDDEIRELGWDVIKATMVELALNKELNYVGIAIHTMRSVEKQLAKVDKETPFHETISVFVMRDDMMVDTWEGVITRRSGESGTVVMVSDEKSSTRPAVRHPEPRKIEGLPVHAVALDDVYLIASEDADWQADQAPDENMRN